MGNRPIALPVTQDLGSWHIIYHIEKTSTGKLFHQE